MNPADIPATELRRAYASGALSSVEALDAVISRVEREEPRLMSLWAVDFNGARDGPGVRSALAQECAARAARRRR